MSLSTLLNAVKTYVSGETRSLASKAAVAAAQSAADQAGDAASVAHELAAEVYEEVFYNRDPVTVSFEITSAYSSTYSVDFGGMLERYRFYLVNVKVSGGEYVLNDRTYVPEFTDYEVVIRPMSNVWSGLLSVVSKSNGMFIKTIANTYVDVRSSIGGATVVSPATVTLTISPIDTNSLIQRQQPVVYSTMVQGPSMQFVHNGIGELSIENVDSLSLVSTSGSTKSLAFNSDLTALSARVAAIEATPSAEEVSF